MKERTDSLLCVIGYNQNLLIPELHRGAEKKNQRTKLLLKSQIMRMKNPMNLKLVYYQTERGGEESHRS